MRDGVVDKRTVAGLTLIILAGELDVATAPALRRALTPSADASMPDLAVDLRQVTFMDCSALGVLLATYQQVRTEGGCLRLIGAEQGPLRLVRLCHLDGILCVHDSVELATAAVCDIHRQRSTSKAAAPG
jgi:anti-sigma B factor antagonist